MLQMQGTMPPTKGVCDGFHTIPFPQDDRKSSISILATTSCIHGHRLCRNRNVLSLKVEAKRHRYAGLRSCQRHMLTRDRKACISATRRPILVPVSGLSSIRSSKLRQDSDQVQSARSARPSGLEDADVVHGCSNGYRSGLRSVPGHKCKE